MDCAADSLARRLVRSWTGHLRRPRRTVDRTCPAVSVAGGELEVAMTLSMHADELDQLDITTTARYVEHGYPWREWDVLRDVAPVYWYERPGVPPCWVVTRYDDVKQVERQPDVFINGGPILRLDTDERLARLADFKVRQAAALGLGPRRAARHGVPRPARPPRLPHAVDAPVHPRRDDPARGRPRRAGPHVRGPLRRRRPAGGSRRRRRGDGRSTSCRRCRSACRWPRSAASSACRRATGPTSCAGPTA